MAGQGQAKMLLCRGEEVVKKPHVAIPTVTFTSNLVYQQKVEKTPVFYNLKSYCINGMMNHLYAMKNLRFFMEPSSLLTHQPIYSSTHPLINCSLLTVNKVWALFFFGTTPCPSLINLFCTPMILLQSSAGVAAVPQLSISTTEVQKVFDLTPYKPIILKDFLKLCFI